MRATLEIPEKGIKLELDALTFNQFMRIGSYSNYNMSMIIEKYPIGKPMTLITSNMPEELREEIIKIISRYCGH